MSRPIAYDRESVLHAAMLCFWQRGYTAVGLSNLEASTGLSRSSIYNSFSCKNGLFLQVLKHYVDKVVYRRLADNLQAENPLQGIVDYIEGWFSFDSDHWGCLLINTSTELGLHDDKVRETVNHSLGQVDRKIRSSIEAAQRLGQLPQHVDAGLLAASVGMQFTGMLVKHKVDYDSRWLSLSLDAVRKQLHTTVVSS